ncbi:unnamed protein product [Linum trigynum]|uniref:Uncharacterized protein n=1 Tax=Linum trigynum TaxID=586398 RepID=A0AAV2FSE4_9ROSI
MSPTGPLEAVAKPPASSAYALVVGRVRWNEERSGRGLYGEEEDKIRGGGGITRKIIMEVGTPESQVPLHIFQNIRLRLKLVCQLQIQKLKKRVRPSVA